MKGVGLVVAGSVFDVVVVRSVWRRRTWFEHETRIGHYLYPLRAMLAVSVVGALAAVATVLVLVGV